MSCNLYEAEASASFPLTGGGLFPRAELPLSLEVIALEEPQSGDECLTVPSADSYPLSRDE